jgi:hypothetical protein
VRIDPTQDKSIPHAVNIEFGRSSYAEYELPSGQRLNNKDVLGVLCRFSIDSLVPSSSDPLCSFCQAEELAAFIAPLRMIAKSRWINDPWSEARADCRVMQAFEAARVGLSVPSFLVSSHYEQLAAFDVEQGNETVIKCIGHNGLARVNNGFVGLDELHSSEFEAPYAAEFICLNEAQISELDQTPSLLQARVNKSLDIRATVIDNEVFAAGVKTGPGDPVDFRLRSSVRTTPYELPADTKQSLCALVSSLDLRFASCDLVLDTLGIVHFLEANVSGNWLWAEVGVENTISEAIAKALITPRMH